MKLPLHHPDVARGSRGVGGFLASPWAKLAARGLLVVVALATLGWIGRTRLADATPGPASLVSLPSATSTSTSIPTPTPTASSCSVHARASPDEPIVLNTATAEDLQRLPGIGARKAQMILVERQRVGRFRRVEDLMKVKGIGRGTIKRLRPLVRVDPPTEDAGADSAAGS